MPRPSGTRVDHYELLEHLADGAQADVQRAEDTRSGEEVVIRFPHARVLANPVLAGRWRREAHLTETLVHPNLQRRLDVGERHCEPYVVVEYAAGGSLEGWVNAQSPIPVGQAVQWGRQLAQALAYLHRLGIIHRDLKPANLLVTGDLELKLADFGAATMNVGRRRWWQLPAPPEGTAEYLSPEQIAGEPGDQRSDIYGWGVVMYELLAGRVPHTGADPAAAMQAHLGNAVIPLRDVRDDVPPGLEAVVLTALRRRSGQRYPSALAVVGDLDRVDELNPDDYDLGIEPAMAATVAGSEAAVLLRFALIIAVGFIGVVAVVLLVSVAVR